MKQFVRIVEFNIISWPIVATALFISFVYSDYASNRGLWYAVYTFCVATQLVFDLISCVVLVLAFSRLRKVS